MSGKRNRDRRPARRPSFRDPRPVILIVCEGKKTEPQYFYGLRERTKNSRVRIHCLEGAGVPKTVVAEAKRELQDAKRRAAAENDDNLAYDAVWCVFDVDEHPHMREAIQTAHDNGLQLAVSNPCFELWLWLHFKDSPGVIHRHDLQSRLRGVLGEYDKNVHMDEFAPHIELAMTRASRLERDADAADESGRNPTTGVWRLARTIMETGFEGTNA